MSRKSMGPFIRVNLLLAVLGAVMGILAAIPITWIGKIIAGAPDPATVANYLWNIRVFGLMGAVFGPILAWSALRRVPLWRAALEPALGAVVGAVVGLLTGSGGVFLFLSAAGIGLASWRLNRAHAERVALGSDTDGVTAELLP